jgi:PhnB protein
MVGSASFAVTAPTAEMAIYALLKGAKLEGGVAARRTRAGKSPDWCRTPAIPSVLAAAASEDATEIASQELPMIETPEIVQSQRQTTAVIHLTCPRENIQTEVGPVIKEILAVLAAEGQRPAGPMFMHHLTMSRSHFDVEVGFPISAPLRASGRVKPGELPAARVARTIYRGPYEGLFSAWDEFGRRLAADKLVDSSVLSPISTLWERYIVGPETGSDASQWRTELNLPLGAEAIHDDTRETSDRSPVMTAYTDLFVVPVPTKNIEAYRKQAEQFFAIWREHGALSCVEVEADDAPAGKVTSFPQSVNLEPGETVFVGIMTYCSRAHRDEVSARAMQDPRMAGMMDPQSMPFDGKRMFFGGFKPFVGEAAAAVPPAIQPYLFFRGRCEEAINYYKATLGAEVLMMMRFKDNPDKPGPDKVPAEFNDRIMHASLRIAGSEIMMSDGMKSGPLDFQCMSLSLTAPTEAEADRLFNALAKDGIVQMPLGKAFFSPRFGAVADKFGVSWMIIVQPKA